MRVEPSSIMRFFGFQILMVLSQLPEQTRKYFLLKTTELTASACPRNVARTLPSLHNFQTRPSSPLIGNSASLFESARGQSTKEMELTAPPWPAKGAPICFPVAGSQKRMESFPPEASLPVSEKIRQRTPPSCPVSVCSGFPFSRFQMMMVLSP